MSNRSLTLACVQRKRMCVRARVRAPQPAAAASSSSSSCRYQWEMTLTTNNYVVKYLLDHNSSIIIIIMTNEQYTRVVTLITMDCNDLSAFNCNREYRLEYWIFRGFYDFGREARTVGERRFLATVFRDINTADF